jgi:enoyl-CoA hydratase/carnithine racemase
MLKGGTHVSGNKSVLYREEKGIARVIFNRPEALNAIDKDLLQQLASILDVAKKDEAVKAVIITGAGEKAFSAGADIAKAMFVGLRLCYQTRLWNYQSCPEQMFL